MLLIRIVRKACVFLMLVVGTAPAVFSGTKSPECLKPFVENIVEDEVMDATDRQTFFKTVHGMDSKGQGGTVNALALSDEALEPNQVFNIMTAPNNANFSHLYPDANSIMGAVQDLTTIAADGSVSGAPGLVGELKVLSGNNFAAAAGVELDLRVGQDLGKANIISF